MWKQKLVVEEFDWKQIKRFDEISSEGIDYIWKSKQKFLRARKRKCDISRRAKSGTITKLTAYTSLVASSLLGVL